MTFCTNANRIRTNSNGNPQNVHEDLDGGGTVRWINTKRPHDQWQDGTHDDRQEDNANCCWGNRRRRRQASCVSNIATHMTRRLVIYLPKLTVMANVSIRGTANIAARIAPATPNRMERAIPMAISCRIVLRKLPSWILPVAKPRMTLTLAVISKAKNEPVSKHKNDDVVVLETFAQYKKKTSK
jgi:hypothetical protein